MEKKHIITIAGGLGSGKSTTAKLVGERLGYPRYSGGDFMRQMADTRGVSLEDLGTLAKSDESIDREIDTLQKRFMDTHDSFVIDSRLGWFLAPESFKVFLSLDGQVAAERVFADLQNNAMNRSNEVNTLPQSVSEVAEKQQARVASERARYQQYYGIEDHYDAKHFDIVVDTEHNTPEQVTGIIVEAFEGWLKG